MTVALPEPYCLHGEPKQVLVFFGGTGHLFTQKILPALYFLQKEGRLEKAVLIAIGRRFSTQTEYQNFVFQNLKQHLPTAEDNSLLKLAKSLCYISGSLENAQTYRELNRLLPPLPQEIIFYLSTLPSLYQKVVLSLKEHVLSAVAPRSQKIALEKPFGRDEESFAQLESTLKTVFSEEEIYYVDHYLGKETVLNLIILKAENLFLERLLSGEFVQQVHFVVSEKEGVGERGTFYQETGAIKDMVQNHMLQLLTLLAVDIPTLCEEDRKECEQFVVTMNRRRTHLLEEVTLPQAKEIKLGQYQSYQAEVNQPHSRVETLVQLPLYLQNPRWSGVPFWLSTGKKLAQKTSFIEVTFNSLTETPNRLLIEIQPEEKIDLIVNVKKFGRELRSVPAKLNLCLSGSFQAATPQAYQKIIHDILLGDHTIFPNSSFIRNSWKIIDKLLALIDKENLTPKIYPDHSPLPVF